MTYALVTLILSAPLQAVAVQGVTIETAVGPDLITYRISSKRSAALEAWAIDFTYITASGETRHCRASEDLYAETEPSAGPVPSGQAREMQCEAKGIASVKETGVMAAIFTDGHAEGGPAMRDFLYDRREADAAEIRAWLPTISAAATTDGASARKLLMAKLEAWRGRPDSERRLADVDVESRVDYLVTKRPPPPGALITILRLMHDELAAQLERATRHRRAK